MLKSAPLWLKVLLLGQLVSAAGSLAWIYLTLYLVQDRHLSTETAALVTALYGLGSIAGNLLGGSLGDRIGIRRALALSKATSLTAVATFAICPTGALAALGLIAGLTGGAGRPLMSAVVATGMPTDLRRQSIALFRAANNAGTVIGPPLGGLLAAHHFNVIFVLDAGSSLVLLVVVLRVIPQGAARARATGHLLRALKQDPAIRLLVLSVLAVDTTYRLLYTALPLFLTDHGGRPVVYGLSITLNAVVIVLFEPRVAHRLRDRPAKAVIGTGYAIVGIGWLLLGVLPWVAGALLAVAVVSVGEMLYKPTATAHAADLAPEGMEGRYQSLYASASIGGMLLSPLLGTTLYGAAPRLVWPVAGLVALTAAAALRARASVPA